MHDITTISRESTNMTRLLHCPQFSRQTKPLLVDMLISSKQVACACADDVLSFAAAATTSSPQVYTREKTISWHLIPIIAFVSLFYSSQLYPSFIPALSQLLSQLHPSEGNFIKHICLISDAIGFLHFQSPFRFLN